MTFPAAIRSRSILSTILAGTLALCSMASAQIFVTSTAASGPGTLKDAIDQANLIPVADEAIVTIDLLPIQLAAAPARAVVNLSQALFPSRSIYITATGGSLKPHIFRSPQVLIITNQARPTTVILQNLRFEGSRSNNNIGGAIRCDSGIHPLTLEIDDCEFVDNQIAPDAVSVPVVHGKGGAISFSALLAYPATLHIKHCLFENNRALSNPTEVVRQAEGSAVFMKNAQVSIEDSTFRSNASDSNRTSTGGALRMIGSSGTAEIRRCTFESNSASNVSGELDFKGTSAILFTADAEAPAAMSMLVEDSMFGSNSGNDTVALGFVLENLSATATFRKTTFVGNLGASILVGPNFGNIALSHCTVWNNLQESSSGGAVQIGGTLNQLSMERCVIAENRRTNVVDNGRSPDVRQANDGVDSLSSGGYNFIGDVGANPAPFTATGDRTGTFAVPLFPKLAAPGNYGGPTRTCPPLPDSALVDFIPNAANVLLTDQRGTTRPQGFSADIGAVELPRLSYDVWDDQITLAADRAAIADPDKDGLQNRLEYYFGTNPMVPNAAPVRIVENENGRFFEVIRSATVRPAFFARTAVETSIDLSPDSWEGSTGVVISEPETLGSLDYFRSLYPAGTDPRRFFRVVAE